MTAALTPPIALDYLRQLSTDIRAAVVLDEAGARLAGDEAIVPAARALVAVAPGGETAGARGEPAGADRHLAIRTAAGVGVAASGNGVAIVVAAGPQGLAPPLLHDVRAALAGLAGTAHPSAAEHSRDTAETPPDAVRAT